MTVANINHITEFLSPELEIDFDTVQRALEEYKAALTAHVHKRHLEMRNARSISALTAEREVIADRWILSLPSRRWYYMLVTGYDQEVNGLLQGILIHPMST